MVERSPVIGDRTRVRIPSDIVPLKRNVGSLMTVVSRADNMGIMAREERSQSISIDSVCAGSNPVRHYKPVPCKGRAAFVSPGSWDISSLTWFKTPQRGKVGFKSRLILWSRL